MLDNTWTLREQQKFVTGEYKMVAWANAHWWLASTAARKHFAHVAVGDTTKIAYTPDARHGAADRQISTRPGRYLSKYFPELGPSLIKNWAGQWAGANELIAFKLAHTPDEIEHVYLNGPNSCMSHTLDAFRSDVHPVRVYGAGDLAIAYLEIDGRITARTVVWPENLIRSCALYGDRSRLVPALDAANYREDDDDLGFIGARLLRIMCGDGDNFVMPYLDGCRYVHDDKPFMRIGHGRGLGRPGRHDTYCAEFTTGLTTEGQQCTNCGEYCDETHPVEGHGAWCESCRSDHTFYCDSCDTQYHDDDRGPEVDDGSMVCQSCVDRWWTTCDQCGTYVNVNVGLTEVEGGKEICENCLGEYDGAPCGELTKGGSVCDDCNCDEAKEDE